MGLLLIVFFSIVLIIAFIISFIRKVDHIDALSVSISLLIVALPIYLKSFFGVSFLIVVPSLIFLLLLILFLERLTNQSQEFQFNSLKTLSQLTSLSLLFLLLLAILTSHFDFKQKSFVNPDPYGYSSVTGAVKEYDNFKNVLNQYEGWVGVPFRWDANWDNPEEFTKLASPWHIPNATLKYGIANGYYLHNGFSFFIGEALKLSPGNEIEKFVWLWNLLTVLSATLSIALSASLSVKLFYYAISSSSSSKNGSAARLITMRRPLEYSFLGSLVLIFALALNSRWFSVFIIEGFGNQLLSYAICLSALLVSVDWMKSALSNSKYAFFFLVLLSSQFFVYAQQIVFMIIIIGSAVVSKLFANAKKIALFKTSRFYLLLSFAFVGSLLTLNIPIVDTAIRALTQSGGGGATHLGVISPIGALGLRLGSFGSVVDVRDSAHQNLFTEAIWPEAGPNGLSYKIIGQGYSLEVNSLAYIYLTLFMLTVLTLFLCVWIFRRNKPLGLFVGLNLIPFFLLAVFYFYTHTGDYLISNPTSLFNDYIWMRILAYNSILAWPVFAFTILVLFYRRQEDEVNTKKHLIKSRKRGAILSVGLLLGVISMANNYFFARDVSAFSDDTTVLESCEPIFKKGKLIFLSTDTVVPELLVTVCGADVRLINDSFPVVHEADGQRHDLFRLERGEGEGWRLYKYDSFLFDSDIRTPCSLECFDDLFADSSNSSGQVSTER